MSHISAFSFNSHNGVCLPEGIKKQTIARENVIIPGNFLKGAWNNVAKDV